MKNKNKDGRKRRFDMHKGVYVLPNFVTSLNLFFGFFAVISATQGDYVKAAFCVLIAGVFDNLDGKVARATNTTSQFGVEYDSLADLVSFGLAPGLTMFLWALQPLGRIGWLAAFLFVACGALRLARFNTQTAVVSSDYFVGLPIPAGAGMAVTTILFYDKLGWVQANGQVLSGHRVLMLVLLFALGFLMVSTVKYNSFKKPEMFRNKNFYVLICLILFVALIAMAPKLVLFLIALTYVSSGPIMLLVNRRRPPKNDDSKSELENLN
ncbi:CDP-diacylglycerol--serine O-phosphatidyltransferase [Desulfatibacillum aliphaticivorans]|uniref:CDP-diacylglycerol--serine O-phosphatidyltransferase n=1 Tax=Desulfatibacillum aliphaticivorans TaxID=218208 RepID=B8F9J8_DESAL|nr:CDP-diacylglycerol--serine O-phosphatidyltransferase [Desulfatibacillum aliphaticivorans]ACL02944.1 CDP-diacylglycerol/serine O-phosphatidyltransferase [Desulfatibacillum aliphaticivorans]